MRSRCWSTSAPNRRARWCCKLAVVYRDGVVYEPVGCEPSTHILKPGHPSADYAASVINEYVVMRLADRVGLPVPAVHRFYTPEPVYLVQRFDRYRDAQGRTQRSHIIDTCQLLNKSRQFKQSSASLESLAEAVGACTNRIAAAPRMFNWLLFNVLIGNDDNHLKNLSYSVGAEGIAMADHYDLLSTCVYHVKALADERAIWPSVPLMYSMGPCALFRHAARRRRRRERDNAEAHRGRPRPGRAGAARDQAHRGERHAQARQTPARMTLAQYPTACPSRRESLAATYPSSRSSPSFQMNCPLP
jgi:hypothetical protein